MTVKGRPVREPSRPHPDADSDFLADRDNWPDFTCSVARSLEVVGTKTAMLMLREAYYGTRRFQDFAARVGVSDAAAAARLRELVDQGLLEKAPYRRPGDRERQEYRLTEKGRELLPVVLALMRWGDRWLAEGGGPIELVHDACGTPVRAEPRCERGHKVDLRHLQVRPGPGLPG